MAITLADLRTKCYNILREEENNSAYPYALVDDLINESAGNWRTKWYDIFQYHMQGIYY